jgi:GNAT superfamily N-acetyltransferase
LRCSGEATLDFSDVGLSRRLERAEGRANADFVDARARMFPDRRAAWLEVGGALAMFDGVDSPLTQSFALGLQGVVLESDLDRIERFFEERHAPVFHEVSPLADGSLLRLLNARAYQVVEFTSVMWRSITREPPVGERARVTVREVDEAGHEQWARVAAEGWSHLPELTTFMQELATVNVARRNHVAFLAEIDHAAVAAGGLAMVDGVALLAGASTVPSARRQGAQRALLQARLDYAAAHGCDLAMMGASPGSDSQRNAERQGFRIAYTRVKWHRGGIAQAVRPETPKPAPIDQQTQGDS